jgi:hypothetical protein
MPTLQPDPWYDGFVAFAEQDGRWAEDSIRSYVSGLKALRLMYGGISTCRLVCLGREAVAALSLIIMSGPIVPASTLKNRLNGFQSIVTAMAPPEFKELAADHLSAWNEAYRHVCGLAAAPMRTGLATRRQVEGYVPWRQLLACRDALPYTSKGRLLLEMYTQVPPLRLDYRAMRIFRGAPDSLDPAGWGGNYMVLDPARTGSFYHIVKLKKVFKNPVYATGIKGTIPARLQSVIEASLAAHPREYLFTVGSRGQRPYDLNNSSFSRWACCMLKATLGNGAIDMHMVRRIYVIAMYKAYQAALNGEEGEDARAHAQQQVRRAAHLMAHKLSMHSHYRFEVEDCTDTPVEFDALNAMSLPALGVLPRSQPVGVGPWV